MRIRRVVAAIWQLVTLSLIPNGSPGGTRLNQPLVDGS